jgi:hypothetical protein
MAQRNGDLDQAGSKGVHLGLDWQEEWPAARIAACRSDIMETRIELAPRRRIRVWHGYYPSAILIDRHQVARLDCCGKGDVRSDNTHENGRRQSDHAAHERLLQLLVE